ncbi:PREDICTED: protein-glutamine gamma-glutamyltransferase E-like [Nanorana parkeri]|uniref:protein-glutamine gamma-glutamyltransferase E-like n=1 Tax=Nanorana parkeri TaxID=125878 RepID=UPI0008546C07|nr:PREDICTED: protein-glutamine gamma-glutamyltransferase E-like [Nanorana parkeri]
MAALKLKNFSMEKMSNMHEHQTDYYNTDKMVLRRGQEFKIILHFNRPIQKQEQVEFYVATGPNPQEADYTLTVFELSNSGGDTYWTATTDSRSSSDVNVIITSPADASIGLYKTNIIIYSKNKKSRVKLHDFILLFNPWATDDAVFLEDENERLEYVLNDSGIIYYGQKDSIKEMGWNFGQFQEGILETCLQMLDRSLNYKEDEALDTSRRYDPAYVGRVLSAMINNFDDEGVLEGNWGTRYTGGIDPIDWSGSVAILTLWRRGGYKPVRYGQCWVFAGVLCTVLRCLGLPTRVITNFDSAHDKDSNLSIDSIYSSTGRSMSKDSMWNYHAWNESWFTRSELGESYGGWQVLDATPQELSGGIHCCGPASVHAIKEGDVDLDYDGPFIFSEVNADRNTWIYYDKDVKEKVYTNTEHVGKNISTKAVGSNERIDITENYKYPEGSEEERAIYIKAREKLVKMGIINKDGLNKRGIGKKRRKKRNSEHNFEDDDDNESAKEKLAVEGKFELTSSTAFGDDISLTLTLKNTGKNTENVKIKLSLSSIEYTGRPLVEIFSDQTSLTLPPKKEKQIPVNLHASQYEEKVISHNLIEVVALCILKGGKKMLVRKVLFIERPPLEIRIHTTALVNNPLEVEVFYTNPLSTKLTDGVLSFGGSGLVNKKFKKKVPMMEPRRTQHMFVEITPSRLGTKQLVVDFTSKHFSAIKGFHTIDVTDVDEVYDESLE